jgi:ACS family hexuronate transporter-like MFS transporter
MPHVLSRAAAWRIAVLATLAMSVSYVDRQTLAALGPTVTDKLGMSETQFGWLSSAFSMAYLVGAPLSGILLDRIGARRGLVAAVLLWSVVAAGHAFALSFAILFGLRILLGLTEAPSFPGASQSVRRVLPPQDRSLGFGLLFTGSSIGAMIAAPLAVWLKVRFGWRFAFVGTALAGLLWVPGWWLVTRSREARAVLADPSPSAATATSAPWVDLLREPAVLRAVLLVMASAPTIMFVLTWTAKLFVRQHWATQDEMGRWLWIPPLFFDAGAVAAGAFASRLDRRLPAGSAKSHHVLVGSCAILASALALLPLCTTALSGVLVGGVALAGGGGLFALLTGDMMLRLPPSRASSAGGLTAAAQSVAYIVANPLVGKAVDVTHSYTVALIALGALNLPGALAWMIWPVKTPRHA